MCHIKRMSLKLYGSSGVWLRAWRENLTRKSHEITHIFLLCTAARRRQRDEEEISWKCNSLFRVFLFPFSSAFWHWEMSAPETNTLNRNTSRRRRSGREKITKKEGKKYTETKENSPCLCAAIFVKLEKSADWCCFKDKVNVCMGSRDLFISKSRQPSSAAVAHIKKITHKNKFSVNERKIGSSASFSIVFFPLSLTAACAQCSTRSHSVPNFYSHNVAIDNDLTHGVRNDSCPMCGS